MLVVEPSPAPLPSPIPAPVPNGGERRSSVFLPKEHGSWSLAFEPLALGLLLAPSPAGATLALAAVAGFFARRPFKAALAPEATPRRREAREAAVMLTALAVAGVFETAVLRGLAVLWPLLLAAPFAGLFAWFDAQNESRAAAAELAGSTAFALLPATLASLAGWPPARALGLAAIALVRSVPTVLTVRAALRRSKGQPVGATLPLVAGVTALAAAAVLATRELIPGTIVVLAGVLLLRTVVFLSPLRPAWSARRIGLFEAVTGVAYVGAAVLAGRAG